MPASLRERDDDAAVSGGEDGCCRPLVTFLVGLLPTSASIGIWAPVLLILLRCLQGLLRRRRMGGAAMLAVEHAPHGRRGRFGAFPQLGVPAGMLIATGLLSLMSALATPQQFEAWGWRIPFLFSIVLIFLGRWIRRRVEESAVFVELKEDKKLSKSPMKEVIRTHPKQLVQAAGAFIGNNGTGYMITGGFILGYATRTARLPQTEVLAYVALAAAVWLGSTWFAANLSEGGHPHQCRHRPYVRPLTPIAGRLGRLPVRDVRRAPRAGRAHPREQRHDRPAHRPPTVLRSTCRFRARRHGAAPAAGGVNRAAQAGAAHPERASSV